MNTYSSISFFKKIMFGMLGSVALASFLLPLFADAQTGPCTIESAQFKPLSNQPRWSDAGGDFFLEYDAQGDIGWFREGKTPVVIDVRTENCTGKEVAIEVKSSRPGHLGETVNALQGQKFIIGEKIGNKEGYEIAMQVGEEYCQELTYEELSIATGVFLDFFEYGSLASVSGPIRETFIQEILTRPEAQGTQQQLLDYLNDYLLPNINAYASAAGASEGLDFISTIFYAAGSSNDPAFKFLNSATLSYFNENFGSQMQFASPCNVYLEVTTESGEVFSTKAQGLGGMSGHLRYACDPKGVSLQQNICEQGVLWKVLETNSNIGGIMPIDSSNPCYDPKAADLRKADCQELLAPLPGFGDRVDENLRIGEYINTILQMVIGFMGIIAVLMIIASGVKYMTTENFGGKADAKATIANAFLGLLIAVSIFIILRTINPDLLNLDVNIEDLVLRDTGGDVAPVGATGGAGPQNIDQLALNKFQTLNIYCPKTQGGNPATKIQQIVSSLENKTVYRLGGNITNIDTPNFNYSVESKNKYKTCPANQVCLDCSGFINTLLTCSGDLENYIGSTNTMFANIPKANIDVINGTYQITGQPTQVFQVGDIIGSGPTAGKNYGHVAIYIGDGKIAESTSWITKQDDGREPGKNIYVSKLSERYKGQKGWWMEKVIPYDQLDTYFPNSVK